MSNLSEQVILGRREERGKGGAVPDVERKFMLEVSVYLEHRCREKTCHTLPCECCSACHTFF